MTMGIVPGALNGFLLVVDHVSPWLLVGGGLAVLMIYFYLRHLHCRLVGSVSAVALIAVTLALCSGSRSSNFFGDIGDFG
ncbi:MAG: hypothetical protein LC689_03430 [Myxococcales bacterium]|nr:hypothetical protein [Myxococcales bacterium]